ncbi:hypothetical protein D3C87_1447050 [compost metagenome]
MRSGDRRTGTRYAANQRRRRRWPGRSPLLRWRRHWPRLRCAGHQRFARVCGPEPVVRRDVVGDPVALAPPEPDAQRWASVRGAHPRRPAPPLDPVAGRAATRRVRPCTASLCPVQESPHGRSRHLRPCTSRPRLAGSVAADRTESVHGRQQWRRAAVRNARLHRAGRAAPAA